MQNADLGRSALRHAEQTLVALEDSPFSEEHKFTVMTVVDSFVDGHALHTVEVSAEQATDAAAGDRSRRALEEIASGPYPRLRRSVACCGGWRPEAPPWMDDSFERGLAALLEGFVRLFADHS